MITLLIRLLRLVLHPEAKNVGLNHQLTILQRVNDRMKR
jgi:hypothetical protein